MDFDNNNHSVFRLTYHLVLVIQCRRKVMTDEMSQYARDIFLRIGTTFHITLEEWTYRQDYVHIRFRARPNTEITKFINAYKSASSRLIKRDFPDIRQKLWKDMFWTRSFCLITTGEVSDEEIKKYIESQGR